MERDGLGLRSMSVKLIIAAAATAAISATMFPKIPPYLPVSRGDTVIMMTGSTNTSGYRIVVSRSGSTEYVAAAGRAIAQLPTALTSKLFSDLSSASPLDSLPHQACMKSASFGTSVFVYWNHHRSPDLTCSSSAEGKALVDDASAIANQHRSNERIG